MRLSIFLICAGLAASAELSAQADASTMDFRCSKLDEKGTLWLGTEGAGIWQIDGIRLQSVSLIDKASGCNVYDLTLDPQGHLWVGTDNGIMTFDYSQWKDIPMAPPYVALSKTGEPALQYQRKVVGMSVNHQKHAWMAVEDSSFGKPLLMRFNGQTFVDLIKPFRVHAIFEDLDANIWMNDGAYKIQDGVLKYVAKIPEGVITCAIQDIFGDVWIGTDKAGVYRYDGNEMRCYSADHGFENLRVTCLHQDKTGRIWMGTESLTDGAQGISYFNVGSFHHLQESDDCPVHSVNTIASDKRGNIWFAGENGALHYYNGRSFHPVLCSGKK